MKLYIKYMVSLRCKMFVKDELQKLGLNSASVELGMVEVHSDVTKQQLETFSDRLKYGGLAVKCR